MQRILYTSRARADLPSDEIFKIIETSARNNPSRDVTGFLVYHQDRFLQLVEGEQQALAGLLAILQRDPRHRDLTIHYREPASKRCFPNWRMRRLGSASEGAGEILRILAERDIGSRCLNLVDEFLTYAELGPLERAG